MGKDNRLMTAAYFLHILQKDFLFSKKYRAIDVKQGFEGYQSNNLLINKMFEHFHKTRLFCSEKPRHFHLFLVPKNENCPFSTIY